MKAVQIATANRVKKISSAVIGIVDIIASSKISNTVNMEIDWELRGRFFNAARERADQTGVALLHHTGDGFLFMLVPDETVDWARRLLEFHALLTKDFQLILSEMRIPNTGVESGLRFGVSAGPVIVGSLAGEGHDSHVVGPDVNLAARMCGVAKINELVLSSRVWHLMKRALYRKTARRQSYTGLKGFQFEVHALHLKPERGSSVPPLDSLRNASRWNECEDSLVETVSIPAVPMRPPEDGAWEWQRRPGFSRRPDLRFKSGLLDPKRDGEGRGRLNESLLRNC